MSLIGWWKLDGDAVDETLNGHNGTVTDVTWVDGKIGDAGSFNGSSSYISVPTISDYLHGRPEASIALWCKKNAVQYGFLQLSGYANTNGNLYPYDTETKVYLDVFRTDRLGPIYMPTSVLEWHHVVVLQEPGSWRLYQNGELVHETSANDTIATDYLQFEIGRNSDSRYANGLFDDVKVYDHALSLKEIKQLAQAKVAHWKFDDFQEPTINKSNIDISTWTTRNGYSVTETTDIQPPVPGAKVYLAQKTSDSTLLRDGNTVTGPLSPDSAIEHTFSVYARATPNTVSNSFTIDIGDGAGGSTTLEAKWKRVIATGTGNNTDGSRDFTDINLSGITGNEVYLSCVQVEKKAYATPWTASLRSGSIQDSSGYEHKADLAESVTPKWTNESPIGSGSYNFTDDYIQVENTPELSVAGDLTLSAWINSSLSQRSEILFKHNNYEFDFGVEPNGGFNFWHGDGAWEGTTGTGAGSIVPNEWTHIAAVRTMSDNTVRFYANGQLTSSWVFAKTPAISNNSVRIGARSMGGQHFVGYIADPRIYAAALSAQEIQGLYRQRASVDNSGSLHVHTVSEILHTQMITDYTVWEDGQTGSVGSFSQNGSTAENWRTLDLDPWGKETVVWESIGDTTSGADGGWNHYHYNIDTSKLYRYSVWWNPRNVGDGRFYLGCQGSSVANLADSTTNTNPYFKSLIPPSNMQDKWHLAIGYVLPYDTDVTTPSNYLDAGLWDMDGNKIYDFTSFKWLQGATAGRHRTYMYYSSDGVTRFQWAYPRVDICDGTEPSFADLMNGLDSRNIDYVREIGGTTAKSFSVGSKSTKISTVNEVGPSNGLQSWWPPSGSEDVAGDNDVTLNGVVVSTGQGVESFYFATKNDSIAITPIGGSVISASVWYFYETSAAWNTIFCRSGGSHHHVLVQTGTSEIGFYTGGSFYSSGFALTPNAWNHITVVKDGLNSKLYVDADMKQDSNSSFDNNSWPLGVIGNYSPTANQGALGRMYDIRVYDRALSPEEIGILYDLTAPDSGTMMKQTSNTLYLRGQLNEVSL